MQKGNPYISNNFDCTYWIFLSVSSCFVSIATSTVASPWLS